MILDYVNQSNKEQFVFYVDEGAYYYREIAAVIRQYHGEKRIIFLVSTSKSRYYKWKYYLNKVQTIEVQMSPQISDVYADEILAKLRKHGQLGRIGGMTANEQHREIMESEDLMSFLASLGGEGSFWRRYKDVLKESIQKNKDSKRLFILLLIVDRCDLPYLPEVYIPMIFGRFSKDILKKSSDFYRPYQNIGYRLRGGQYGKDMCNMIDKLSLIQEIESLCQVIAPQVTEHEKNYSKNILESFIRPKDIYKRFHFNTEHKMAYKEMLYRLKNYYENISYYWIQLGLAEQVSGDFNRALTHFQHAKSIRPNSYSVLHAIGRNYIRQASVLPTEEKERAKELFGEGEKQMLSLIREQEYEQNMPYSIHSYLLEKIHFCRRFNIRPPKEELHYLYSLCEELETRDGKDISTPVKQRFFRYLKKINRMDVIHGDSFPDLKLLFGKMDLPLILGEDPEGE